MRGRKWDFESQYGKGKVLLTIKENPGITSADIADALGGTNATIYRNLSDLMKRGYIEQDALFPEGRYTTRAVTSFFITGKGIEKLQEYGIQT